MLDWYWRFCSGKQTQVLKTIKFLTKPLNIYTVKHSALRNILDTVPERIIYKFSKWLPERLAFERFWSEVSKFYTEKSRTDERGCWPRCGKCLEFREGSANWGLVFHFDGYRQKNCSTRRFGLVILTRSCCLFASRFLIDNNHVF